MNDRDTFAAAALTGLIANGDYSVESTPIFAYRMADAMLRERGKTPAADHENDEKRAVWHTNHDAVPEAIANAESVAPQPTAGDRSGNPTSHSGTGKQPAPPSVETDGFSPGSRSGQINRTPERESPRRECGESSLRDVPQLDNSRAAGGPEHHISDRSQPVKNCVSDRSKPINDNRLSALEELSAMDQELELEHGITGNPMIKARRNKESAGAGITDAGPRLRQMNDVLEENERLRGQLAWTERERDSLRVSINNLRDYVAELNAELYAASAAKTDTTQPRNGALPGCETVPDPDSRVWEAQRTPQPQDTPPQGSVQDKGSFRDSRNANEPVAWAVVNADFQYVSLLRASAEYAALRHEFAETVPLYRHPQPVLTDAEREAVDAAILFMESRGVIGWAATLRGLLDRTK